MNCSTTHKKTKQTTNNVKQKMRTNEHRHRQIDEIHFLFESKRVNSFEMKSLTAINFVAFAKRSFFVVTVTMFVQ